MEQLIVMCADRSKADSASLEALLNAAVDSIVIIDEEGTILLFNPAAESIFGYTSTEVIGKNVTTLMPQPYRDQHDGFLKRYRDTGKASIIGLGREAVGLKSDGEQFPIFLSVGEITGGSRERYVGLIRDLSEQRKIEDTVRELESRLAHADRLVTLGELTAGIAHEINQPLTAIAAYADAGHRLLTTGNPVSDDEIRDICKRVAKQARRAGAVVSHLRKLASRGNVVKARHRIKPVVQNVLMLFEYDIRQSHVTLKTDIERKLPEVFIDDIQIQQVLVNLIKNSIDALREAATPDPEILVTAESAEREILVKVVDNGPGVDEKLRSRLFEPFFTTKPHGVGLGLSICRNIANAHGGNLRHETPPGGGCRFTLSLPLELIG
jgi:two-component system sensor kinase FixL